jgi:hypothetical protein
MIIPRSVFSSLLAGFAFMTTFHQVVDAVTTNEVRHSCVMNKSGNALLFSLETDHPPLALTTHRLEPRLFQQLHSLLKGLPPLLFPTRWKKESPLGMTKTFT